MKARYGIQKQVRNSVRTEVGRTVTFARVISKQVRPGDASKVWVRVGDGQNVSTS